MKPQSTLSLSVQRIAVFAFLIFGLGSSFSAKAQLILNQIGQAATIDLSANQPGVVNGPFVADEVSIGSANPANGDLDADAWHFLNDGSSTDAINSPATFPSILMAGQGFNQFPPLPSVGLHATNFNGQRALGFHPSGSNFTSGSMTLRIQNLTGQAINALDVAYNIAVLNDRDRSNSVNLYYSTNNAQSSYVLVPDAELVSPGTAQPGAAPVNTIIQTEITGISIPQNGFIFLRWVFEDVTGAGERDEFIMYGFSFTPGAITVPFVTVDNDFFALHHLLGETPIAQSFNLTGNNLTNDVSLNVPAPFEISLDGSNFTSGIVVAPSQGSVDEIIYVRLFDSFPGNALEVIEINSPGAGGAEVFLYGVASPKLYINELMAQNTSIIADESGEYDDWFEIYNPSTFPMEIGGYYFTDDLNELNKYAIPEGTGQTLISAEGFMLCWADDQSAQGPLHTNFALSAAGESIALVGIDGLTILDSYTFGAAVENVSEGRISDGAAEWIQFPVPTPNASNTSSVPFLNATPVALNGFQQVIGAPSEAQQFVVNAANLSGEIELTCTAPFEIALEAEGVFSPFLVLELIDNALQNQAVFVRLNSSALGNFNGSVSIENETAQTTVALSGVAAESFSEVPVVFINELMASNSSTIADEFGEFDDWVEIYNPNPFEVNLAGFYLSDTENDLTKYQIPTGSSIAIVPANGFLLFWCDNQPEQGDLHTNFGLSAAGESIVLTAPDGTTIVDSFTFGPSTTDVSFGRNGDGNAQWIEFSVPTPGASNGPTSVLNTELPSVKMYPNPTNGLVTFTADYPITGMDVFGMDGRLVKHIAVNAQQCQIDLLELEMGWYIVDVVIQGKRTRQRLAVIR
ncbi:MAG: lamin tail domain-containing protein [Flavobacteriales bacterium]